MSDDIHEGARKILNQIDSAEHGVLRAPSRLTDRERVLVGALALLGVELAHADEQETAILRWLPELRDGVRGLGELAVVESPPPPVPATPPPDDALRGRLEQLERKYAEAQQRIRELTPDWKDERA